MYKRLCLILAIMLCAGVLIFPLAAYAAEEDRTPVYDVEGYYDGGDEEPAPEPEPEPSVSGIPPYDGPMFLTPGGTGTVVDNVFMESSGLEFFTFTTNEGNVFYLVVDRLRTQDNVYFLNAVTESDLLPLAQKDGSVPGSGVPATPGSTKPSDPPAAEDEPKPPPANTGGMDSGMLIFVLIGAVVVGIAGYYFKIVRPKKQAAMDDDGADEDDYEREDEDADDDDPYGEDEDD